MRKFIVVRPNDVVLVGLLKHKESNRYSYINFTKEHICLCEFVTEDAAIKDMDKKKEEGKIIFFKEIWIINLFLVIILTSHQYHKNYYILHH